MNPTRDNLPTLDDERFDLLVDGELPEPERRQLLSRLDHLAGGWRRCALAFLEAQSWKEGLQSIRREPTVQAPPARPIGRTSFPGGLLGTLAAMAACFLIALGLGLALNDVWRPGPEFGLPPVEMATAPKGPEAPGPKLDERKTPAAPAVPGDSWQWFAVPVAIGPGGTESIRLPARQRDRVDEQWMDGFAPTMPPELLEALERDGHEVRWSRRLLPFRMEDGQQLVVPLEQVELRFVGNAAYQ